MKPLLAEIRAGVDAHVAAQPVPYHTSDAAPAFESLTTPEGGRAFPIQLEPFSCTRFEMAEFAAWAQRAGIRYIGICCGGGPHHVRAMAEALGRDTPASLYSPVIDLHPVLGSGTADHAEMGGWAAKAGDSVASALGRGSDDELVVDRAAGGGETVLEAGALEQP
jgi:betaine-homocysteine S-methyltransferase